MSELRPGPWLRLIALVAAAGCCAAVVSGALELGAAHRGLAALALPPLAALVAAAWVEYRRLLVPSVTALVAFLAAALVISKPAHLALAGLSLAATLVVTAETFRGEPVPAAPWRDYITLTKPRIMTPAAADRRGRDVRRRRRACRRSGSSPSRWSVSRWPAAGRARSTTCSTATSTG